MPLVFNGGSNRDRNVNDEIFLINKNVKVNKEMVEADGIVNVVFQLVNTTELPINIIKVNPHCSCTGYELERNIIPVRDTTALKLSVSYDQLKILKGTYATIKIDHKIKYLLARISLIY